MHIVETLKFLQHNAYTIEIFLVGYTFFISNKVCCRVQVEWASYSIPAMQIALISGFADELGVTNSNRGYDPPFIPRLGTLQESMGIKDVSVTDVDAQMAIMAQIEEDRRKAQTVTIAVPSPARRGSEIPSGSSARPARAPPPQPPPPQRRSAIDEYLELFEEDNAQRRNATPTRTRKEPVRRGSNQRSGRPPRGR